MIKWKSVFKDDLDVAILALCVFIAIAALLAIVGASGGQPQEPVAPVDGVRIYAIEVPLPDGREVPCVLVKSWSGRGVAVSCDWGVER